ncbi:dehydrogenase E1 component [Chloroherpeton thalassium ATCC 35110]|uniref:3-methyl-2-oxobutanoate dehydrogenase (2-methylpropanoyl-transferring) n=1 Tax=Chloroherpeton thalassium (strain ATCC 35110 / GB-78) TaxID=517418 RepID=B3QWI8_CHLT3|nr:alpha-ketoacid dehydrogenase subunit alpha/beta [Chloroherpeton thalassium]ACF14748.1 dehydrogenase E1 component [Chloroherpeton thalassium ATCC 35110]
MSEKNHNTEPILDSETISAQVSEILNSKDTLKKWYKYLQLGRSLDLRAASYLKKGMGWSYHAPYQGHDGIQLALGLTFRAGKDFLFPYYRDMLTCLAAGLTPEEILLNGLSRDTDVAGGGRHMSNHFAKPEIRIQNGSSLTGNHSLHAVGVARAIKKYNGDEIAFYSGGESACSEGYFYEAVSGASREMLPVIFVIQNNRYGISVPVKDQSANPIVAENFSGFLNLRIIYCDGTDVFDSWRAMQEATKHVLDGNGAVIVHADCVRIGAHSNSDNHQLYRSPEELEKAKERDPLPRFRNHLIENKLLTEDELKAIEDENEAELAEAAPKAEAAPLPSPDSVMDFVLPEYKPVEGEVHELTEPEGDPSLYTDEVIKFLQAINFTQIEEFERNENTFLWGQDVASKEKGGVFNAEKGMLKKFGNERVFNAPIAEDFIVGTANGFCRYRDDIWVLVEGAEFADYIWPAMEQVVELSHEYWRTKGQFVPNMLIRVASGGYINGGLYHSQNVEGSFTTFPGLRVLVPAFADDMQGLIRSAMRTKGATVILEPKFLYNHPWAKTKRLKKDVLIPFGKARYRRYGSDLSIITYGTTVHHAMRAADRLESEQGISVEVLDLRSLIPLDKEAIFETVRKTSKVLVVHEDKRTGGFGGEIAALIAENCFESLDAPVIRLGSLDTPVGFSKILENAILLNDQKVYDEALKLASY